MQTLMDLHYFYSSLYSSISPGWHSRALHRASSVENLIARALPVFRMERFVAEIPTFSASSPEDIFLRASITSIFTIMDIILR